MRSATSQPAAAARPPRTSELVRALLPYARRRPQSLTALVVLTVVSSGVALLKPWPMKVIVDHALLGQPLPDALRGWVDVPAGPAGQHALLWWSVGAMAALFAVAWLLKLGLSLAHVSFGRQMVFDLAADLLHQMQRLSLRYHRNRALGDSIRRVTGDCGCVSEILKDAVLPMASSLILLVAMAAVMWRLDPTLTLLAVAVMPALVLTLRRFAGPMLEKGYAQQEAEARVYAEVERTLSAVPVVQMFDRSAYHDEQLRRRTDRAITAAFATTNVQLAFKIFVGLWTALGTALIVYVGGGHALDGTLTAGTLLVFLAYLASLYAPIESLMYGSAAVQGAAGSARRVVEMLRAEPEVRESPDARPMPRARGDVELQNVEFAYDPASPVLRDVSIRVSAGETVAIVGATGAGKSTLLGLVPRFIDPSAGRVLIDGQDVRTATLASLRGNIAVVLQDSLLFPMTLAQNIAYGRPAATRDQVVAAAQAAGAHEFISRLPGGYDARVGEGGGATLSGGERQRVAIARALLMDAPVLLLDEPTSNLDGGTERAVMTALRELQKGRTTIVIAHRLSTVRHADRIVVLDHGRVAETGTHEELVNRPGGIYAAMCSQGQFDTQKPPRAAGAAAAAERSDEP